MSTPILITPEIAWNRFVKGEIEAGLVFAANAIEYQYSNPTRWETCLADAEDCYATASNLIRQAGLTEDQPQELKTMLDELQRRLDLLGCAGRASSAAA